MFPRREWIIDESGCLVFDGVNDEERRLALTWHTKVVYMVLDERYFLAGNRKPSFLPAYVIMVAVNLC